MEIPKEIEKMQREVAIIAGQRDNYERKNRELFAKMSEMRVELETRRAHCSRCKHLKSLMAECSFPDGRIVCEVEQALAGGPQRNSDEVDYLAESIMDDRSYEERVR